MIYFFDTYYYDAYAHTGVIGIKNWEDTSVAFQFSEVVSGVGDYESGAFYKRELPCLMSIIEKIPLDVEQDILVVDGYVVLSDEGKLGLGGYLYKKLGESIPVIGVAKNDFVSLEKDKIAVYRGESKKALFVTALGYDIDQACQHLLSMDGDFRIPTILKQVDQLSREIPK